MQFLSELNEKQRQAVVAGGGPIVIIAGPGTGKTKTLAARIRYLIDSGRSRPERMLALTFTKKAAEEMRARVGDERVRVNTFHGLCHELLGGEKQFVGEPERLTIIAILKKSEKLKQLSTRELALSISRVKNLSEPIDDPALEKVVAAYNAALAEKGLIDFDDLLVQAKARLKGDPDYAQVVQSKYDFILVDEFQDTNRLQYELLQLIHGNDNLFIIGDPLQSIYGFRGASGDIFEHFKRDFPNATVVNLTINYRSAPEIVRLSNAIFGSSLAAHHRQPGGVRAVQVLNEYSEASWIVNEIQRLIGGSDLQRALSDDDASQHRALADFAILYRNRSAAVALRKLLADSGLPYQIVGDGSPYDDPQVQMIINLLGMCATGEIAELNGLSILQCEVLVSQVNTQHKPADAAATLMTKLEFTKTPSLTQLIGTLVRFATLDDVHRYFTGLAGQQFYDPAAQAITLLTIHASKGLEFRHVFLVGAEEDILPGDNAETDEEKRLFYVAATRAKERLDILHTTTRAGKPAAVSRFIQELPTSLLPNTTDANLVVDKRRLQKRQLKRAQTTLF